MFGKFQENSGPDGRLMPRLTTRVEEPVGVWVRITASDSSVYVGGEEEIVWRGTKVRRGDSIRSHLEGRHVHLPIRAQLVQLFLRRLEATKDFAHGLVVSVPVVF